MEKIDLNDLLDEEFANELIEKMERRRTFRKNVKCACLFFVVSVLGLIFFNAEQISRAGEDLIYYAFGKDVGDNVTKEENEVYLLKEPISFGDENDLITLQYAYLVGGKLTMNFRTQPDGEADDIVISSKNKTYSLSDLKKIGNLSETYEDDNSYQAELENITDKEFTLYYKEEKCDIVLEPVSGYTKEELLEYKNSSYKGTAVVLNKDLAAFGVHIDTINALSDWTASILVNPLSNESNVSFIGNNGVKYPATPYLDGNSFMPTVNMGEEQKVKPNFMCINGVNFQREYEMQEGPGFTLPLMYPGEKKTLNKVLDAGEVKVKILEVICTLEGNLRFKVSTGTNYGKVCYANFSVSSNATKEVNYTGYSDGLYVSGDESYKESLQNNMPLDIDGNGLVDETDIFLYEEYPRKNKEIGYSYCYIECDYEKMVTEGLCEVQVNLQSVGIYMNYPLIFMIEPEVYEE